MSENMHLRAALWYARFGWYVFPVHAWIDGGCSCGKPNCSSPAKHPLVATGLKSATTKPELIQSWWTQWPTANIAVATGAISGIVVLDADGEVGCKTLGQLESTHGDLPITPQSITGGGGTHMFFAHPGHAVPNSARKVGESVDVRGDGGYVVLAPSTHKSGNNYRWEDGQRPHEVTLAPVPKWLMPLMLRKADVVDAKPAPADADTIADRMLAVAVKKAAEGNRNATGLWLACQLRDAGLPQFSARSYMLAYVAGAPGEGYTEQEAAASLKSAYSRPQREPPQGQKEPYRPKSPPVPIQAQGDAATQLEDYLASISRGDIYAATWPWRQTTRLTQALIPGSLTTLVGSPGVGKTFMLIQCLRHWMDESIHVDLLLLEKNFVFNGQRLLAQLANNALLTQFDFIKKHPEVWATAMAEHRDAFNRYSAGLWEREKGRRYTLTNIHEWAVQRFEAGSRIVMIDPITMADAGDKRWISDDDFVLSMEQSCSKFGASAIIVTHPPKAVTKGAPSGNNTAGGAAYYRFVDTLLILGPNREEKRFNIKTPHGDTEFTPDALMHLDKTRNGTGSGMCVAFNFKELSFSEVGVVLGEVKKTKLSTVPEGL